MTFLSGLATGALSGLQMGASVQDARYARKSATAKAAGQDAPAAGGLYGRFREVRDQRNALAAAEMREEVGAPSTAASPAAAAAQNQPDAAPAAPAPIRAEIAAPAAPAAPAVADAGPAAGLAGPPPSPRNASLDRFAQIIGRGSA